MRITTRAVFQMTDDPTEFIELERDSYEYDGQVSEAKGGGGDITQDTTADPWSGIQPYLLSSAAKMNTAAGNVPEYYPGQTYAPWDPNQVAAMQGQLNYAASPEMNATIANGLQAVNSGLDAPNVYDNPALQSYVDAAVRPLTQAYQEQILPGIRDQAEMYGGAGSRTGLAEGTAARSYMDAIASTTAPIYSQAYGQGLEQQRYMGALMPQMLSTGLMPWQIQAGVGAQQQGMSQQAINEAMARYDYNMNADYNRYKDYYSTLMGTPWGGSSTTGPNPNAVSPAMSAMGGGMLGYGAGTMIGGAMGGAEMGSVYGPYGALAGAALGYLMA